MRATKEVQRTLQHATGGLSRNGIGRANKVISLQLFNSSRGKAILHIVALFTKLGLDK